MVTTLSDTAPLLARETTVGGRREPVGAAPSGGQPAPQRIAAPSPWRSPTFYLAIPLTALLFVVIFVIRTAARLRPVARRSATISRGAARP